MDLSATIVLALLAAVVGHPDGPDQMEDRRFTVEEPRQHIWGGGAQCSSHLSDGPVDADLELILGGLPATTTNEVVHLQWWSARKSHTRYDPLGAPVNCSVHSDMTKAYPQHTDADFNGGNVRVSAVGVAVIRVRAPSTYYVWRFLATPHIHLRLCRGDSGLHAPSDTVMLGGRHVWVSSARRLPVRVLSALPYAGRQASPYAMVSGPSPVAVIVGVRASPGGWETLPETTDTVPYTASGQPGVNILGARGGLALDALEFSPVFRCLLARRFYDHFSSGCARKCPNASASAHSQCVRDETREPEAQLEASWQLGIRCGATCGHGRESVTLHQARLSFADHLDIPFQEVEVSVGFLAPSSRRLYPFEPILPQPVFTAYLTVKVTSNRISAAEGNTLLARFPADQSSMTALLGLEVRSAHSAFEGSAPNLVNETIMGQGSDPYMPAYVAMEGLLGGGVPSPGEGAPSSCVLCLLPMEAIVGIAVGVVVVFALLAGGMLWRRRRQRLAAVQAQQAKTVSPQAKTVGKQSVDSGARSAPEVDEPIQV